MINQIFATIIYYFLKKFRMHLYSLNQLLILMPFIWTPNHV